MTPRRSPTAQAAHLDLTPLAERLRQRLVADGAPHGGVGALLLALRGASGAEREVFAARLGADEGWLEAAESGEVAPGSLPMSVRALASATSALSRSWVALALEERRAD